MSLVRRLALSQLRNIKARGSGGTKGGFFAEGKNEPGGLLFNETPPPPGQSRKWESWEGPWYFSMGAAIAILAIGLPARPDSSMRKWADRKAEERLADLK